nr:MAG TPA: hypothetical protein [Caudoviricetes sp.]
MNKLLTALIDTFLSITMYLLVFFKEKNFFEKG